MSTGPAIESQTLRSPLVEAGRQEIYNRWLATDLLGFETNDNGDATLVPEATRPQIEAQIVQHEWGSNNSKKLVSLVIEMRREGDVVPNDYLTDGLYRQMRIRTRSGTVLSVNGDRVYKLYGGQQNSDPASWTLDADEKLQLPTLGKPLERADGRVPFSDSDDPVDLVEIFYKTADASDTPRAVYPMRLAPDPFREDNALMRRRERVQAKIAKAPEERQRRRLWGRLAAGTAALALVLGGDASAGHGVNSSARAAAPAPSGQLGHSYATMETKILVPPEGGTWTPAVQEVEQGVNILYPAGSSVTRQRINYAAAMNEKDIMKASGIGSEYVAEHLSPDRVLTVPDLPLPRLRKWLAQAGKVLSRNK